MKLYFTQGACSLVVRIVINEMGVPAHFEAVDLRNKRTESGQNFLTINPKGAVPVLELDNGSLLTENAVILQYLADTYKADKLLPSVGHFERYRVLEWVNYITTEVHKSFGALFNPSMPEELKQSLFIPLIHLKFKYINQALNQSTYLTGQEFTLPDAYLFVMLRWAHYFKIDLSAYNNLTNYMDTLQSRPSIIHSLKEEGL